MVVAIGTATGIAAAKGKIWITGVANWILAHFVFD